MDRAGGADGKSYVSQSPQPYSKFKLQPSKNNLMVYGQNGKAADIYLSPQGHEQPNTDADIRTINAVAGRNSNGYPINTFDKHNAFAK